MVGPEFAESARQPAGFPSRKVASVFTAVSDSLRAWMDRYQSLAVAGVRSGEVAAKVALHLRRFRSFFLEAYRQERISTVGRRDVIAWQRHLAETLAPSTVNNHLTSLSGFATWVVAQCPQVFPAGNPAVGLSGLALPPLEPRSLSRAQVRSLKNLCDRLERLSETKGRHHSRASQRPPVHIHSRPWRDRAVVYVLLSTGLRRGELVRLDLDQVAPSDSARLRVARRARLVGVRGKGGTQRTVFLSADARTALADYLERERPIDAVAGATALWLSAASVASRRHDGRLSGRSVNTILERIGRLHDAEQTDAERHVSPLRPHDLRHTLPSSSLRPLALTRTSSSVASGTARSGTSLATQTRRRMWLPATSRRCDVQPVTNSDDSSAPRTVCGATYDARSGRRRWARSR